MRNVEWAEIDDLFGSLYHSMHSPPPPPSASLHLKTYAFMVLRKNLIKHDP